MLTHRGLVANAAGAALLTAELFAPGREPSRHISYLPLAHIYERFNVTLQAHFGGAVGFYRGNVLELLEDVEALAPTTFSSVPRLYNRIYDKVLAGVEAAGPVARKLFWTAFNSKRAAIERGDLSGGRLAPLWDRLVFAKIRARLGGERRWALAAGRARRARRAQRLPRPPPAPPPPKPAASDPPHSPPPPPPALPQAKCGCSPPAPPPSRPTSSSSCASPLGRRSSRATA